MAPLITHLVVAQRLWPMLRGRWPDAYGDFLFGNLAVDVDKFCPDLEQETTHLVGKDGGDAWLTQRSRRFLERQAEILRAPFAELLSSEQAFVLGYLCHLAADEATTGRFLAYCAEREERVGPLPSGEAIATVIDKVAAGLLCDRDGVVAALERSRVPMGLLSLAPDRCLVAMRGIVFPLIWAGGGFEAYMGLVRRNSLWHRHGQTGEEPVDTDLEAKLIPYSQRLLAEEAGARQVAAGFDIASVVDDSLDHCRVRLAELA